MLCGDCYESGGGAQVKQVGEAPRVALLVFAFLAGGDGGIGEGLSVGAAPRAGLPRSQHACGGGREGS